MRDVITISLPKTTTQLVKKRIQKRGFRGMSEYVRYLFDQDSDMISQDELLKIVKKAQTDYKQGKLKKYNSMADIVKKCL